MISCLSCGKNTCYVLDLVDKIPSCAAVRTKTITNPTTNRVRRNATSLSVRRAVAPTERTRRTHSPSPACDPRCDGLLRCRSWESSASCFREVSPPPVRALYTNYDVYAVFTKIRTVLYCTAELLTNVEINSRRISLLH